MVDILVLRADLGCELLETPWKSFRVRLEIFPTALPLVIPAVVYILPIVIYDDARDGDVVLSKCTQCAQDLLCCQLLAQGVPSAWHDRLERNLGSKDGFLLTISQSIVPIFIPLWPDSTLCRRLRDSLVKGSISCLDQGASMVHDGGKCALKVVANCHQDSTLSRIRVVIPDLVSHQHWLASSLQGTVEQHTWSVKRSEPLLRKRVMTLSTPLIPRNTRCFPWAERNEQSRASLSSSNDDLPCLGASHGVQVLTKANHLRVVSTEQAGIIGRRGREHGHSVPLYWSSRPPESLT